MLPGISGVIAGFAEDPTFAVSYIGYTEDAASRTTYTFAGASLGDAHSARTVFVLVHWSCSDPVVLLSSATIAGVSATIHAQTRVDDDVDEGIGSAIISASVPSGTTGTIAFTLSGGGFLGAIGVIRVANLTEVVATATAIHDGASPVNPSTTIDVSASGALLACVTTSSDDGGIAWTGVTEQYEDTDAGGSDQQSSRYSGALSTGMSLQANRPVSTTQTISGNGGAALVAVSIR